MVDVICPPLSISSIVVSLWLAGCLAKSTLIGWREYYGGGGVGVDRHLCGAQQTRAFDPMLFQYWPTANGAGPTLKQHWVESSCLLGELSAFWYTRAVCVWSEQAAQCSVYLRRWPRLVWTNGLSTVSEGWWDEWVTLPSRHRIRNSSPSGLRTSTLPLERVCSPQYSNPRSPDFPSRQL